MYLRLKKEDQYISTEHIDNTFLENSVSSMKNTKDYSEDERNLYLNELNKKKAKELAEKYDMGAMDVNSEAPPEIVNTFLNQVEQFEEAWDNCEDKKIEEILEFPVFRKVNEIPPDDLEKEIENVLDIYSEHNINIDIIEKEEVSEAEFYIFLTEELTQHETQFIRIEGMITNFIYEDFHPSDKLDSKDTIRFFLDSLFFQDQADKYLWISKEGLSINGILKTQAQFTIEMQQSFPEKIDDKQIVFNSFEFDEKSKVNVDIVKHELVEENDCSKLKDCTCSLLFYLERSEYGGFEIKACDFL